MKKTHLILLLILTLLVCSCDTNTINKSNTKQQKGEENYFAEQALKNNQSDSLFLGLCLTMNKEQALAQLDKKGAWNFYSTYSGDYRLFLIKEHLINGPEDCFPSDNYVDNNAFFANIILKSEDGRYSEERTIILLDFVDERIEKIHLCFEGDQSDNRYDCENSMFETLKNMLIEKYGKPYNETYNSALWVDGAIHIELTNEGIRRQVADKYDISETGYTYRPFYLITYSDWLFSTRKKEQSIIQQQNELRKKRELDSLEQERLSKEYKGL